MKRLGAKFTRETFMTIGVFKLNIFRLKSDSHQSSPSIKLLTLKFLARTSYLSTKCRNPAEKSYKIVDLSNLDKIDLILQFFNLFIFLFKIFDLYCFQFCSIFILDMLSYLLAILKCFEQKYIGCLQYFI
jgi:hypothetical protein